MRWCATDALGSVDTPVGLYLALGGHLRPVECCDLIGQEEWLSDHSCVLIGCWTIFSIRLVNGKRGLSAFSCSHLSWSDLSEIIVLVVNAPNHEPINGAHDKLA